MAQRTVDPALPPLLLTSEPGSFAANTLAVRVPAILRETIAQNNFPAEIEADLEALYAELTGGVIRRLKEKTTDAAFWNAASAAHFGRTWLDVPWYWAEAYFYRRVLEATRYFQPGPWQGFDPFASKKAREWAPEVAPAAVSRILADLPEDRAACFQRLLHASLWGNRTDLSYMVAAHLGATAGLAHERDNLLIDDTTAIWQLLTEHEGARVALVADNAGTELLMDVVLIDYLLCSGLAAHINLHLKPQPFYVSDAMPVDLVHGLDALVAVGGPAARLAARMDGHIAAGDLRVSAHACFATSIFFSEMPAELHREFCEADLVLFKGDANYRRLVEDRHWPPTLPFAQAVAYFPAPVVALRTFKSELAVGLAPGQAERLTAEDPQWLVNGRRGVIQFCSH